MILPYLARTRFAELFVRSIPVHAAHKSAHEAHRRVALLGHIGSRGNHAAVDVLEAEVGKSYQLAHAELEGRQIERVTHGHDLNGSALHCGKGFRLPAQGKEGTSLLGSNPKCFNASRTIWSGGRPESGDARLLAFQVRRLFDLGTRHQAKRRHATNGGDNNDVAAGGARGECRRSAGME